VREAIRRYIIYSFFSVITASSSLVIIRDKDVFSSCPARIEAFSVTSPVSTLNPARAVDSFFVILSASAKSLA
jgi:hypothetical protein